MAQAPKAKTPLFEFEPQLPYLKQHWKRLSGLVAGVLLLFVGIIMGITRATKPEGTVPLKITVRTECSLGGETLREQVVWREVKESFAEKVKKEKTYKFEKGEVQLRVVEGKIVGEQILYTICAKDLYKVSVLEDGFGDTRFHKDAAWLRGKQVAGLTEDQMAQKLMGPLRDKYPSAKFYEVTINTVLYDYSRSGDLFNKYERHDWFDKRSVRVDKVEDIIALPTPTPEPTPVVEDKK